MSDDLIVKIYIATCVLAVLIVVLNKYIKPSKFPRSSAASIGRATAEHSIRNRKD